MNGVAIIYNAVLAGDPEAIIFCIFMGVVAFWVGMVLVRIPKYFEEKEAKLNAEKQFLAEVTPEGGLLLSEGGIFGLYDNSMNKHSKYLNYSKLLLRNNI